MTRTIYNIWRKMHNTKRYKQGGDEIRARKK